MVKRNSMFLKCKMFCNIQTVHPYQCEQIFLSHTVQEFQRVGGTSSLYYRDTVFNSLSFLKKGSECEFKKKAPS